MKNQSNDHHFFLGKTSENEKKESPKPSIQDQIETVALSQRRIFLSKPIDMALADEIIRKIWFLEAQSSELPVLLIINSPGGSVDAGFAIWDQLKMMSFPITTLVTGIAASMASILSLVAQKGKRFATPRSRIMIHQPAINSMVQGQATDLEIQAKEILKTKRLIVDLYSEATGKPCNEIERSIDRDMWMTADEAIQFGLIDKTISSYQEIGH
ncbi:MAG: ATP-dependent Clp protease proteolytic subunit [Chlamydia sp.]